MRCQKGNDSFAKRETDRIEIIPNMLAKKTRKINEPQECYLYDRTPLSFYRKKYSRIAKGAKILLCGAGIVL